MAGESDLTRIPENFFDRLIIFMDELRQAGYKIGIAEYHAVQALLINLAAAGRFPIDLNQLQFVLGPLLCTSQEEQEDFEFRFSKWVEHYRAQLISEEHPKLQQNSISSQKNLLDYLQKLMRRMKWLRWVLISLGGTVVFAILYIWFFTDIWFNQATQDAGGPAASGWPWSILVVIFIILMLVLIWKVWWRYQVNLYLQRRTSDREIDVRNFFVQNLSRDIFSSRNVLNIAQKFRRHQQFITTDLNVESSIDATVKKSGFFTPVLNTRKISPEYIVLIDRRNFTDHLATYIDTLIDRLAVNNVYFKRYYFDQDPRSCHRKEGGDSVSLKALYSQNPGHRLIIIADNRIFIDPISGGTVDWVEHLDAWEEKIYLMPESDRQYSRVNELLTASGFRVGELTDASLENLIDTLNERIYPKNSMHKPESNFPSMLLVHPKRWIQNREPEDLSVEMLMTDLHGYLGSEGLYWFRACAVYPELNWNLTLYLGHNLSDSQGIILFNKERLIQLSRLPWFRLGRIPDWLRSRLVRSLSLSEEQQIRECLNKLLLTVLDRPLDSFALEYTEEQNELFSRFSRQLIKAIIQREVTNPVLADYIFVSFMSNHLSYKIPEVLYDFFSHKSFWRKDIQDLIQAFNGFVKVNSSPQKKAPRIGKINAIPLYGVLLVSYTLISALYYLSDPSFNIMEFAIVSIILPSQKVWLLRVGDVVIILGLLILFVDTIKTSGTDYLTYYEHIFSIFAFILYMITFLFFPMVANPIFLILGVMSLVNVINGFTLPGNSVLGISRFSKNHSDGFWAKIWRNNLQIVKTVPLFGVMLTSYVFILGIFYYNSPDVQPMDFVVLNIYLPSNFVFSSGQICTIRVGDVAVLLGLVILFIEIQKSADASDTTIVEHVLSLFVFIFYMIAFLLAPMVANSTFLILTIMSLIDVLAGVTITINTARRGFTVR